jgi:flagellar basal-body rod protein FlgB
VSISLDILRLAQTFAAHAATRQQAISQNIANANTPGYRSRDAVSFSDFLENTNDGRRDAQIRPDARPVTLSPDGNTVSLEHEMMRAVEARQSHDLALGVYSTARDILRAVITRR